MKRYSVIGWIPKGEKEGDTLDGCGLSTTEIKKELRAGIPKTKAEADCAFETDEIERVRVSVTIDVERI